MKLHLPDHHNPIGNSFGYSRTADRLRAALIALDAYANLAGAADAIVHVTPPHLFRPLPGALNVFFTMFEAERIPAQYRAACRAADLVVVPSRHNQRIFADAGIRAARCALGIDTDRFRFVKRQSPRASERFRYLWVGAPNPRKGWPIVDQVWRDHFAHDSAAELYIKTTSPDPAFERRGNVIADSRPLADSDLARLYASAHCFVFPSYGEGFGLTLAEAMATGLPSIFTPYGGVRDFANSANAYPLRMKMIRVEYFGANFAAAADPDDLARTMRTVRCNFPDALDRGRRASDLIASDFTWRNSALNLLAIISARFGQPRCAAASPLQ